MKMKKIMCVLLTAAMAMSLAACEKKEADDGRTVVTVWTGDGGTKSWMKKKVEEWNNTVGKEKGIRIDYTVQDGNISEMVELAFTSGTAPDLFSSGNMTTMAANGQIAAVDELPGGSELIEQRKALISEGINMVDGVVYQVPTNVTTGGLIYNKDMFRAAGIVDENGEPTPPETLDEFVEYAKRLTNPEKKEYGYIFPAKWSGWYDYDVTKMATATDGLPVGYNPKTGLFDYSGQATVMKALMKIKEDGSFFPGAEGLDNDAARSRFAMGGIGMKTAGSFDYGVLTDQFPTEVDWGVCPYPSADKNDKHRQFMSCGGSYYINKASIEKVGADKLAEVFMFFAGDDMIRELYKEGFALPYDFTVVEDIEVSEDMQQWKDFAAMTEVSQMFVMPRLFDTSGETDLGTLWVSDIWTGTIPYDQIDAAAADKAEMMNKAVEKYQASHPEYDGKKYILSDWDTKR